MTLNIWGCYFGNPAHERIDAIETTIRKYSADVVGLQEMSKDWYKNGLLQRLSDEYVVVAGSGESYIPLLYKRDLFALLEMGYYRYTDTTDKSKGVTWAVLQEQESGKKLGVCNTHVWWKHGPEHEIIREKNAAQLLDTMQAIKAKYGDIPVFAFGDFNSPADMAAMRYLAANGVVTSYEIAETFSAVASWHGDPIRDKNGIYRGKATMDPKERSLDHIVTFKEDVKIKEQKVVQDQLILDVTDHSPVYIDFDL